MTIAILQSLVSSLTNKCVYKMQLEMVTRRPHTFLYLCEMLTVTQAVNKMINNKNF